jgi:hypothetical protein
MPYRAQVFATFDWRVGYRASSQTSSGESNDSTPGTHVHINVSPEKSAAMAMMQGK